MRRLAVLSLHTSPLAQPGTGDGGGMNVYVRELSAALARAGVECDVFTRAWSDDLPATVNIEPGFRVHHVSAGPPTPVAKEVLPGVVDEFADGVLKSDGHHRRIRHPEDLPFDAVHANYWLSGVAGHLIKHQLDLPLVSTFHTLDRVKAEASPEEVEADAPHRRAEAEATIIRCSDAVLASCSVEAAQISELYHADPSRIRIVAPGVDHAFFGPGDRRQARRALSLPEHGPPAALRRPDPAPEGGGGGRAHPGRPRPRPRRRPPGHRGRSRAAPTVRRSCERPGRTGRRARPRRTGWCSSRPQPHELLSTYYRAADVCLVPSRSESFGLVALEAAACGTPVVASDVGGLSSLIDHGRTGYLVEDPSPEAFAAWVRQILAEPLLAERLGTGAVLRARRYTWARAAHLLRDIYADLTVGRLVECS